MIIKINNFRVDLSSTSATTATLVAGPIILQMLEKSALPEEVCVSIGACVPTTAAPAPPVKLVRLLSKVGKLMAPLLLPQTRLTSAFGSQDESCEFCKVRYNAYQRHILTMQPIQNYSYIQTDEKQEA